MEWKINFSAEQKPLKVGHLLGSFKSGQFLNHFFKGFFQTFAEKWLYFLAFFFKHLPKKWLYFLAFCAKIFELKKETIVQKNKPWPNFFETFFRQIWSIFLNKFLDFDKFQKWLYFFLQILLHYFGQTDGRTRIKFFEIFFRHIWSSFLNKIFGIFSDLYTK